jgi:hypothetical protein
MSSCHGLLLQVDGPDELIAAAHAARELGVRPLDGFSPFPIDGLAEAIGSAPSKIPWIMLACGVTGAATAFGMMSYATLVSYPLIIGGRPHFAWPAFVPVTFELMILFAALGGAISLLLLCGLPSLYHPVFNARRYRDAAQAGFFLMLPDSDNARSFLTEQYPDAWTEVVP